MSNSYPPVPPVQTTGIDTGLTSGGGKADAAKEEAAHLGEKTAAASQQVAGTAKEEVGKVASEAKTQAKDLFNDVQGELKDQASAQQQRVASGLHSLSDELSSMAEKSDSNGVATDLVHQVASRAGSVATWLEDRDPGSLLTEVRNFARERPGTFIGIAAVAGVLAGRLTRSIASEAHDSSSGGSASTTSRGATAPVTTGYSSTPAFIPADAPAATGDYYAGTTDATTDQYDADVALTELGDPDITRPASTLDDKYLGDSRL